MLHRPVYGGEGLTGSAVAAWLAVALKAATNQAIPADALPEPPAGMVVADGPAGRVIWDASRGRPLLALDWSGAAWVVDEIAGDADVTQCLQACGYRRGEMRVTRRVTHPGGDAGMVATMRATQWTTPAVRGSGQDTGTVWK